MKPLTPFEITPEDVETVRALVNEPRFSADVLERKQTNVDGPAPPFDREEFWHVLVGCLLTTQQDSSKGAPVDRFFYSTPFQLALEVCARATEEHINSVITDFGGIRRGKTISHEAKINSGRLNGDLWAKVETHFRQLAAQRNRPPQPADIKAEREAAHFADEAFLGIGPKQARNLWQWLGLSRYEIPLDSRVCKWINGNLSAHVETGYLSDESYYDTVVDYVQALCERAAVLPCIFDGVVFDYEGKGTSSQDIMTRESKGTTETGYVNANGQVVIRDTGIPGTDHLQRIYQVACSKCGHVYGANGSDCYLRKCPQCQGGAEGLPLTRGAHA